MPKKTRPDSEEARLKRDTEDIMNRVMLLGMRYFKLQLNRKIEEMEAGLGYSAGEPVLETASQTFVKKGLSPTHKTAISQGQRKRWQAKRQASPAASPAAPAKRAKRVKEAPEEEPAGTVSLSTIAAMGVDAGLGEPISAAESRKHAKKKRSAQSSEPAPPLQTEHPLESSH
jgi:hypothetical protein